MAIEEKEVEQISGIVSDVIAKSLPELLAKASEEAVEKAFEAKGINKIEKSIFGKAKEVEGLEGAEKSAKYIKAVFSRDLETVKAIVGKAMTEGTDSQGGFVVPEEFRGEIVRLVSDFGIIRKQCRVIPMKRDTLNLPKVSTSVTVYWPGEATAGTASQPVLGQVQLLAKTLVALTPVTNELLEDADADVVALLSELFAEAIAGEEDAQGLAGTGAPFTGITAVAGTNLITMAGGKDTFAELDVDDLRDLVTPVKVTALAGAGFYMHPNVWAIVQKLKENNTHIASMVNPLVTGDASKAMGAVGYIWGYPVYLSEKIVGTTAISTKFIIFGNMKYAYLGDRKSMTLSISEHASIGAVNMFEANMSAVRITERIGFVVALPSAFSLLKTAAA